METKEIAQLYAEEQAEFIHLLEKRGENISATVLHEFQTKNSKWYRVLKKMQQAEFEFYSKRTYQALNFEKDQ